LPVSEIHHIVADDHGNTYFLCQPGIFMLSGQSGEFIPLNIMDYWFNLGGKASDGNIYFNSHGAGIFRRAPNDGLYLRKYKEWIKYNDPTSQLITVPDYENEETTNRITTNGGSWTVDRVGYVRCNIQGRLNSYGSAQILVNNKSVAAVSDENSSWITNAAVVPVSVGDVVKLQITNGAGAPSNVSTSCLFIPPKFIQKTLPVVVEKNGSYSLEEIKTAETWIDGRPIYKKTINYTPPNISSCTSAIMGDVTSLLGDVKKLIKYETVDDRATEVGAGVVYYYCFHLNTAGQLVIYNGWPAVAGAVPLSITFFYTKTTD
jgi:hypothetical protein